MHTLRARVVAAAVAELGSSDWRRYCAEAAELPVPKTKPQWCGIFCAWCIKSAGLGGPKFRWRYGIGIERELQCTASPEPGDVAYFAHFQHRALVESVNEDGTVTLINGNSTGGAVARSQRPLTDAVCYYSIAGLLPEDVEIPNAAEKLAAVP